MSGGDWKRSSRYSLDSPCGNYRIAKAYIGTTPRYAARYMLEQKEIGGKLLGCFDTLEQAKKRVDQHREGGA